MSSSDPAQQLHDRNLAFVQRHAARRTRTVYEPHQCCGSTGPYHEVGCQYVRNEAAEGCLPAQDEMARWPEHGLKTKTCGCVDPDTSCDNCSEEAFPGLADALGSEERLSDPEGEEQERIVTSAANIWARPLEDGLHD